MSCFPRLSRSGLLRDEVSQSMSPGPETPTRRRTCWGRTINPLGVSRSAQSSRFKNCRSLSMSQMLRWALILVNPSDFELLYRVGERFEFFRDAPPHVRRPSAARMAPRTDARDDDRCRTQSQREGDSRSAPLFAVQTGTLSAANAFSCWLCRLQFQLAALVSEGKGERTSSGWDPHPVRGRLTTLERSSPVTIAFKRPSQALSACALRSSMSLRT